MKHFINNKEVYKLIYNNFRLPILNGTIVMCCMTYISNSFELKEVIISPIYILPILVIPFAIVSALTGTLVWWLYTNGLNQFMIMNVTFNRILDSKEVIKLLKSNNIEPNNLSVSLRKKLNTEEKIMDYINSLSKVKKTFWESLYDNGFQFIINESHYKTTYKILSYIPLPDTLINYITIIGCAGILTYKLYRQILLLEKFAEAVQYRLNVHSEATIEIGTLVNKLSDKSNEQNDIIQKFAIDMDEIYINNGIEDRNTKELWWQTNIHIRRAMNEILDKVYENEINIAKHTNTFRNLAIEGVLGPEAAELLTPAIEPQGLDHVPIWDRNPQSTQYTLGGETSDDAE